MIQVIKRNIHGSKGLYQVKLIVDGQKVEDIECECPYGKINKDFWKNPAKKPCKHAVTALSLVQVEMGSGRWKK